MSGSFVCGFDVGGTKLLALAFDPEDPARWRIERRGPTPRTADDLVKTIVTTIGELHDEAERTKACTHLHAVGLGIAGLVDRGGTLRFGPNLPGIVDTPLAERLVAELEVPVDVENDATAAAWAEHRLGAGMGIDEMLLITLGTGIGAGIVSGGHLVLGRHGFAGEAGHMIVDPSGPLCPCGQRGCWERYASGSGLGRLAREAAEAGRLHNVVEEVGGDPDDVRGEELTVAARAGDREALAVFDTFAWWAALGFANLTNLLDVEAIVIGGGLVSAADLLLEPMRVAYEKLLYASDRRAPARLIPAELGEESGAVGAGLLAVERL
jgi:glucokinase